MQAQKHLGMRRNQLVLAVESGLCRESKSSRIFFSKAAVSSTCLLTSACAAEVFFPDSNEATMFDSTVALKAATPNTMAKTALMAVTIIVVFKPEMADRVSDLNSDSADSIRSILASA